MLLCIIRFKPIFLTIYNFVLFAGQFGKTKWGKILHKLIFMHSFSLSICYGLFL